MKNRIDKIQISFFENVLFLGPNYINHKGGIGAVIYTYSNNISSFKFIPTYDGNYNLLANAFLYIKSLSKISINLLTDHNIKIVHIHGASRGSFIRKYILFLIIKYIFNKKIVYHLHGGGFHIFYQKSGKTIKYLIAHLINQSDLIVCLSTYWQNFLNDNFNPKSVKIINNPIELPKNLIDKNLFKSSYLSLLFLGKVNDSKGIFDLVTVLNENKKTYEGNLKLIIGGNGETDRLKAYISTNHLQNIIEFKGWINQETKKELLVSCDILVLPSYNEGLPISILEGMSYGKAIISTNVGGIPEIVQNNRNGFIFEPGDTVSLKSCIDGFLQKKYNIKDFGDESLKMISDYSIDKVIKELEITYYNMLHS